LVVKSAAAARRCEETTREEDLIDLLLLERAFPIVVIALVACALFVDIIIIVNKISHSLYLQISLDVCACARLKRYYIQTLL